MSSVGAETGSEPVKAQAAQTRQSAAARTAGTTRRLPRLAMARTRAFSSRLPEPMGLPARSSSAGRGFTAMVMSVSP